MVDLNTPRQMKAIRGRLSFNKLTAAEAYEEAITGPFAANAKSVADVKPYANLLLTQTQYERVLAKITDEFFPMCAEQYKIGDKEKYALSPADIKGLLQQIEDGSGPYNTPFKLPSDRTLELMPDCVITMKLLGNAGGNFNVEAIVKDEKELAIPDPDRISFKNLILPIEDTKHKLYRGCWVIAPFQLYTYRNGKNPGFSAGGSDLVFSRNDTEFGGGVPIDAESIFLADED